MEVFRSTYFRIILMALIIVVTVTIVTVVTPLVTL